VGQHVHGAGVDGVHHLGAGGGVRVVGDERVPAGGGRDHHVQTGAQELGGGLGHDRDPMLARNRLSGDSDPHEL
jgi:hypothetical protein